MKPIALYTGAALMTAFLAGCSSPHEAGSEKLLGAREQKAILAKARPVEAFGFEPSFPYGNEMLYFGATRLQPDQQAGREFLNSGMPVIEIRGDSWREKLRVLLDTAANASWMPYPTAAANGVVFLKMQGQAIPYLGTSSTEGITSFAGIIPQLTIGQITLSNTPFYVRMAKGALKPVVYNRRAEQVDAVLGYDNLRQFQYIQFNLQKHTVRFSTSTPYQAEEDRLVGSAGISSICRDSLAVNGAIAGEPVPIVLDFAGDYAFARGDTRQPVTKQIELGEVVYLNVATELIAIQDRYPRAGRKMLEKYLVTICPREAVVYFERP